MPKSPSFSSKFKSLFSSNTKTSPSSSPDLSNMPPEFQKAYKTAQNAPNIPDVPVFEFTADIEDNLRSLTNRIRDLESQLGSCKALSKSKYLDQGTIEHLYQCQDRLECALEESFMIRSSIVPPDSRKLLYPQLLQKSVDLCNSIASEVHISHKKYRLASFALGISKYLAGGHLPDVDIVKEHQDNLESAKAGEQACKKALVAIFAPHYGDALGTRPKTLCTLTGNALLDYVALDCQRHNISLTSKGYEDRLSGLDPASTEYLDALKKTQVSSYLVAVLDLVLDAICPDGCPSPSPILSAESLYQAQRSVDEIYSNALKLTELTSYINSADSTAESEKRRESLQEKLDSANSEMQLAAVKLSESYSL